MDRKERKKNTCNLKFLYLAKMHFNNTVKETFLEQKKTKIAFHQPTSTTGNTENTPFSRVKAIISSVQFSSVSQSCPTLCEPMNRSTPGLPVHHHLPELTQIHVHRVSDAIQPSHPLSSLSPPAPNPSQHQSF